MICVYYTTERTDSRAFLTRVLEEYYGVRNAAQRLQFGLHGKPYLKDVPVRFNLSHSGALTAVAAGRRQVGLDVQQRDGRARPALTQRLTEAERREDFFRLWTAKEAYVKYCGGSLAAMLPRLRFENGVLSENGTPVAARLYFGDLKEYALCVCAEKEETILYRPI